MILAITLPAVTGESTLKKVLMITAMGALAILCTVALVTLRTVALVTLRRRPTSD
ncbi:hypothetical protein [Nocardia sp. NPDC004260]